MNHELPDVQGGFRKAGEPEIKLPTSTGSSKKAREFQKRTPHTSVSLTTLKPLNVWITTNWKILKEMGILDHLTCLPRSLNPGQETTVRTGHRTRDWFQIGKGVPQDCISSPCLFSYIQSTSCEMPGWMKHKLESRLLGEILITSDM